ncbi:MAG TPA: SBBP repeat-containing protein [Candidatus Kapabacteria bacterium]|nr:SBBP repeat-containing protein [Candidatus Kapabacteria bacterium]
MVITQRTCWCIVFLLCAAQIASAQDSLKIISPDGGEKFFTGNDTVITWTGIPLTDTVKLEYSIDAGTTWILITDTATGGRYPWQVPGTVSGKCLIKVEQDSKSVGQGWAKLIPSGAGGYATGDCIATDRSGDIYVTGQFTDILGYGNTSASAKGGSDIYIAKLHPDGIIAWLNSAGGPVADVGEGIAIDSSGSVYVTGWFQETSDFGPITLNSKGQNNIFVVKYGSDGIIQWAQRAGGMFNDEGMGIAVDTKGNIFVTGFFEETADFNGMSVNGKGLYNIFIAKYHTDGSLEWVNKCIDVSPQSSREEWSSVTVDTLGNSYIVGIFYDSLDFGNVSLKSSGDGDIFIAKYSADGNLLWAKKAGGKGFDVAHRIVFNSGNIYIVGNFSDTANFDNQLIISEGVSDIFLAKYNLDGTNVWVKRMGGKFEDFGEGIALDNSGNLYLTGFFTGTADFQDTSLTSAGTADIFVAKCSLGGNIEWAKRAGGSEGDWGTSIASDSIGDVYTTGSFNTTSDFVDTTLTSNGNSNIFVWKISPLIAPQSDTSDSLFSIIHPKPLVSISDDSGYPGDHKNIPIILKNVPISSVQSLATSFSARIAYDNSLLDANGGIIQKGNSFDTVTIHGSLAASDTIGFFPVTVMLGQSTTSPLNIVDFNWLDGAGNPVDYDAETESGTFTLLYECSDSTIRNFLLKEQMPSITSITPNPSNGIIHIEIKTTETGRTRLELLNLLGMNVAVISDGELKPGSHSFNFNSQYLSGGSYFLTMTTPTVRRIERVDIEK